MQTWLVTGAQNAGPPVRVVLPNGRCRRLYPVLQDCTGFSVVQLGVGATASGSPQIVQSFGAGDLARLQSEGLPLGDDRYQVDISIQGGANARAAVIVTDTCGC